MKLYLPTQAEIAKKLGVSRQAVGFALGHYRDSRTKVSTSTRQRIVDAARELGYRPHRYAQLMRGKKSGVLGMIQFGSLGTFATERAACVAAALHKAGYEIFATDVAWYDKRVGVACSSMLDAHVEGVILLAPADWFPEAELEQLRAAQIPVVGLSGVKLPGVPQVRADTCQGMFDLTQHLLRLGYRRLAMVTLESNSWPVMDRIRGFHDAVAALKDARVEAEVIREGFVDYWSNPYRCGEEAMKKLLRREHRPDAVACSNDDWAFGALGACGDAGVRVPDEIAVTGFDNTLAAGYGAVRLTTVMQPLEAMAQKAVELLVKRIRGETISPGEELVKLPCRLVVRQSCGSGRGVPHKKGDSSVVGKEMEGAAPFHGFHSENPSEPTV